MNISRSALVVPRGSKRILVKCLLLLDRIAYLTFCLVSKLVRGQEVLVVAYHSVGMNPSFYAVTPQMFRVQIDYLRKNYEIVPLDRIVDFAEGKASLPRKSAAITFDDGYRDNFSNAYSYLRKYDLPGTVFVCTGFVGKSMRLGNALLEMLSWREIMEMSRNNVEIGAHMVSHPNLSECSAREAEAEIAESKREIETHIGKPARYFAYPSSKFRRDVGRVVRSLGFRAAFLSGLDGIVQSDDDTLVLHRLEINSSTRSFWFKAAIAKGARWHNRLHQCASPTWRTAACTTPGPKYGNTPGKLNSVDNSEVSVVILTKNSAQTIELCLRSVMDEKPGEVLAIDALSTDGTLEILKRYGVTILTDNVSSLGHSRQMGVQAAKGTYVMFVDSDATLTPGCIGTMRRELEKHGWTGIHAKLLSAENVSYWQRAEAEKFHREHRTAGPADRIDTIVALFQRKTLLACPFDGNVREAAEDVDLSRRLVRTNHRLGISSAVAYHYNRRELQAFVEQRFRYGMGHARLAAKYGIGARTLIAPLSKTFYQIVRDLVAGNIWLLPYWAVEGISIFLGTVLGISRLHSPPLRVRDRITA
jgi:peptidoglycan/xylan/chitin deacetylase (PgdA/CDA1 family)/glycosyltransferase involved in cell wall biosynthesis